LRGPAEGAPRTLGHEPVGRAVEVDGGVDTIAIGDVVTGPLTASFAELIVVPAEYAVVVPPGLRYEAGIGEPLGCVVEALPLTPFSRLCNADSDELARPLLMPHSSSP
jgi:L-iditol 2-dehydrogenase